MQNYVNFLEFANSKNKKKIVLIIGSARSTDCCPNEESKASRLAKDIQEKFYDKATFEIIDLSVKCDGINVLPCKGCVSTSAFHCHFPCSCYSKESDPKDLMYEQDVYKKLKDCDGFFVITPINWGSCSSVVKSFFDRLVCVNLTLTQDEARKILGKDNLKNSEETRKLEKSKKYNKLLKNHLEGKYAGFFGYGNYGGADYREFTNNSNSNLPVFPDSLVQFEKTNPDEDPTKLLDPLVRQCVYSGVYVPDDCVKSLVFGFGVSYSESNDAFNLKPNLYLECGKIFENFIKKL